MLSKAGFTTFHPLLLQAAMTDIIRVSKNWCWVQERSDSHKYRSNFLGHQKRWPGNSSMIYIEGFLKWRYPKNGWFIN